MSATHHCVSLMRMEFSTPVTKLSVKWVPGYYIISFIQVQNIKSNHIIIFVKLLKQEMTLYISQVIDATPTITSYPIKCDKSAFRLYNMYQFGMSYLMDNHYIIPIPYTIPFCFFISH